MNTSVETPNDDTHWSETTRAIVSVLLVGHLFALSLVWLANNDYGSDTSSRFVPAVKRFANPYLFAFWMDRRWDQRLTTGEDLESDFRLRLTAANAAGETETVEFPDAESKLPEMRERWQELARGLAQQSFSGGEEGADLRALAFGKAWLKRERAAGRDWDTVTVQGIRRNRATIDGAVLDPTAPSTLVETMLDPDHRPMTIYAAKINWPGGTGDPSLSRLGGDKRDKAPVVPSTMTPKPVVPNSLPPTNTTPDKSAPSPMPTTPPTSNDQTQPAPAPTPGELPKIP